MPPHLPLEIVELIFASIDPDQTSRPTLAAICASCKAGQKIVTPLLYQRLGYHDAELDGGERTRRLQLLCLTVLTTPRLALLARTVEQYYDLVYNREMGVEEFDDEFSKVLRDDISRFGGGGDVKDEGDEGDENTCSDGNSDEGEWHERLHHATTLLSSLTAEFEEGRLQEALSLLISMHCPQLRNMRGFGSVGRALDPEMVRQTQQPDESVFCSGGMHDMALYFDTVVEIRLTNAKGQEGDEFDAECLRGVVSLPNLRALYIDGLRSPYSSLWDLEEFSREWITAGGVTELIFTDCLADLRDVYKILEACPHARRLTIEFAAGNRVHARRDEWHWLETGLQFPRRLEELRIVDCEINDDDDLAGIAMVVSHMKSLVHLEIPQRAFYSPRSIEDFPPGDLDAPVGGSPVEDETLRLLEEVIPDSLEELVIISPRKSDIKAEFDKWMCDPRMASLDEFIVMDCAGEQWLSKTGEERTAPIVLPSARGQKCQRTNTDIGQPATVVTRTE